MGHDGGQRGDDYFVLMMAISGVEEHSFILDFNLFKSLILWTFRRELMLCSVFLMATYHDMWQLECGILDVYHGEASIW